MFGNISKLLEMKKKAEEMKLRVSSMEEVYEEHGITVTLSGLNKVKYLELSPDFLTTRTHQEAQDQITNALINAQNRLAEKLKSEFSDLTGGMDMGF
jgi:DNA-binding protein YbaB